MLSVLQHFLFSPRQCALIHTEQLWTENRFTAEGRLLHEREHTAALERTGLDLAMRYLHRDRPGRPGLALNMMEEFRHLADRLALSLINLGQVKAAGFPRGVSARVMTDASRRCIGR